MYSTRNFDAVELRDVKDAIWSANNHVSAQRSSCRIDARLKYSLIPIEMNVTPITV
jgi:hypothetical protein